MTLRLVDATHWSAEQMAPHWPNIMACLHKYCRRYAREETPENMLSDVIRGTRRMWLVLDENDEVVLVPLTGIETLNATGMTLLFMAECGGSRLKEAMPLLAEIEDWAAREHGASVARFFARKGWTDYLEAVGYKAVAIVFEKDIGHEQGIDHAEVGAVERTA